jgi:heat-inducible transcriptional repressor
MNHNILRKVERFARSRLFNEPLEADIFDEHEQNICRSLYQEAMASYFVSYTSMSQEDLWQAGFSRLLQYPEFEDSKILAASLSLFENKSALRGLLREAMRADSLKFWIGDELKPYVTGEPNCALVAIPYRVGDRPIGALAVLGPQRMFYLELFKLLQDASNHLSDTLSRFLTHHKITYRMPESHPLFIDEAHRLALEFHGRKGK